MENLKPERPKLGTVRKDILKVPVCKLCGYVMSDWLSDDLCADDCPLDGISHKGNMFFAIWERTDIFIKDEDEEGNIIL